MSYTGSQSHHRLPGFAHFESPFSSLTSNCHSGSSSTLDPLVFKFPSADIIGDGPIASTAGLDLSIVNGLDLSSSTYEGLNLSNNAGVRNESNNQINTSSNSHQQQAKNSHQGSGIIHQQNINTNFNTSQGLTNESEMVLNLSTQIGLNLTRPGQELDYTQMLDIEQTPDTFTSGLQDDEFDYYPDYYANYADTLVNMEQQRSSPLNLEHRSSPLNLTAVGAIGRKRRSTNFNNQYNQNSTGMSNMSYQQQNVNFQTTIQSQNASQQRSGKSIATINQGSSTTNLRFANSNQNSGISSSLAMPGSSQAAGGSFDTGNFMELPPDNSNSSGIVQTAPINMGKSSDSQQHLIQDFSFNNQAFDYRLPNKLTSFYNQQNEENSNNQNTEISNLNINEATTMGTQSVFNNEKVSLPSIITDPATHSTTINNADKNNISLQGGKTDLTVKDSEYDISFSYFDDYPGDTSPQVPLTFPPPAQNNQNGGYDYNYLMDMNPVHSSLPGQKPAGQAKDSGKKEPGKSFPGPSLTNSSQQGSSRKFECDSCLQSFSEEAKLKSHMKVAHAQSPPKVHSDIYSEGMISNAPVNLSPMKNKTNNELNRASTSMQNNEAAQKKVPSESNTSPMSKNKRTYKCNMCSDTFTFQSACKRHEKLHVNSKPFSCDKCDKKFSRNFDLKNHAKIHDATNEKCANCKEEITGKGPEQHKCTSPPAQRYPCPICPRSLSSKREWGAHMWKHTGQSKYIILSEDHPLPDYTPTSK